MTLQQEKYNDTKLLDGATSLEEYLKMKGYVKEEQICGRPWRKTFGTKPILIFGLGS